MSRTSTSSVNSSSSSSSSSSSGSHRSRRHFTEAAAVVVLVLVLALSAGAAPTTGPPGGGWTVWSFLKHNQKWLNPCQGTVHPNPLQSLTNRTSCSKDKEAQTLQHVKAQLDSLLVSLEHSKSRGNEATTWSTEDHKKKFKFLRPFVANVSTWERRLSIYWASLELVINVHNQQRGTIDSDPDVLKAMGDLNTNNLRLLCHVREYRQCGSVVKKPSKPIGLVQMNRTLNNTWDIRDVSEIKIHRWYIMCRLECYLRNMQAHVLQLIENGAAQRKTELCEVCPHSRTKGAKKHPKHPKPDHDPGIVRHAKEPKQPNHTQPRKDKKTTRKPQPRSKKGNGGSRKRVAGETTSSSPRNSSPRPNRQG